MDMDKQGKSGWIEEVVITDPNGVIIYDDLDEAARLTTAAAHEILTYIIDPFDAQRGAVIRPFLGSFGAGTGTNTGTNADVNVGAGTSVNDEPETVGRALSRIFDELRETWNTQQKLLPISLMTESEDTEEIGDE
jgi:hypothetical protein